ncbi:MAG: carboxypeptidase regulatory-like domain-containing protein [Bacteroidia bacterium]|nr:carboxypeptidase regulatory-like domain-containing protein [Bacteroidia bacterium]
MLRRILSLSVFAFILTLGAFAQDGKLTGRVIGSDGEPLSFATIVVKKGDLVIKGASTDDDGRFSINPIDPGTYSVEVRYLTTTKTVDDVTVNAGQTRDLPILFSDDVTLEVVEIIGNQVFEKDPAVVTTLSGEDIKNLSTRDVNSVAALTPGVYQSDEGDGGLIIRGGRSTSNVYYIDGVKIRGATTLPQSAISQYQVYTGGTPAEFGDFTGGVISITTAAPSSAFAGGLEYVTSEYLDPFGHNLGALTLSGPIITKKEEYGRRSILGFFLSGEAAYDRDQDPAYTGIYSLKDGILADLQGRPVEIADDNLGFRSRAAFVTADSWETVARKATNESLRVRGLGRLDFQPTQNILVKLGGTYEYINTDQWSTANMLFAPDPQNEFDGANYRGWLRFQQTFSGGEGSKIKNLFYSVQADYSLYQRRFQNSVHKDDLWAYGHVGSFTFDEVPIYGYINNPQDPNYSGGYWQQVGNAFDNLQFDPSTSRNPLLANYNTTIIDHVAENGIINLPINQFFIDPSPVVNRLFSLNDLAFRQGILNGGGAPASYSVFSGIGANAGGYTKFDYEQFRLSGQATAEIQGHNIKGGFEFEQRVERFYSVGARSLWTLGRQYTNFHLLNLENDPSRFDYITVGGEFQDTVNVPRQYSSAEQTEFDKNVRLKLGLPVDGTTYINIDELDPSFFSLDMFSAAELLNNGLGPVSYYGFDYLGNRQETAPWQDFFNEDGNRPQNAFAPTYLSAFIQDKFEFEDIIFNVGLRVDRFDANQPVLKDNYSLYPTYTAGEIASGELGVPGFTLPSGIGSDFVPYVDNASNPSEVIGYRDDEVWYDRNGAPISSNEIRTLSGGTVQPAVKEEEVSPNSFEDYTPQTVFMPRISFSFPISDLALFFAHYDVLSQRPGQNSVTGGSLLAGQLSNYAFLENSPTSTVLNPNLLPEITIDYEAGFKQKVGETMALTVSAFYREQRNMIRFRRFNDGFPFSYDTYDNLDFGTVKGFSFSYDMRRTRNVQLRASYTLQYADATGSDFNSARGVTNSLEGVGILRVNLPIDADTRHRVSGSLDYRFMGRNRGPAVTIAGKKFYPLEEFGANASFQLTSGRPFTQSAIPTQSVAGGIAQGSRIVGTPNGRRLPWTYRVDLRADKNFVVGGKMKGDKLTKAYDFNVYCQVLNLFNTQNIQGVYAYTGLPTDDGWLTSDAGKQFIPLQISPEAYVDQYSARLISPGVFSIPRRIRLGVMFNF